MAEQVSPINWEQEYSEQDLIDREYMSYYIAGEPLLPCPRHTIVAFAHNGNGPFIFGCRMCTIRYIQMDDLVRPENWG